MNLVIHIIPTSYLFPTTMTPLPKLDISPIFRWLGWSSYVELTE